MRTFSMIGLKTMCYCCLIMFALTSCFVLSVVEYGLFYYFIMPTELQTQKLDFAPSLEQPDALESRVYLKLDNTLAISDGYLLSPEQSTLKLSKSQSYNVSVSFEVAETSHNMALGNIYLAAKLHPCEKTVPTAVITRMGSLNYKSDM